MMGVIGITGSLSAVAENFPEMPQYMIQNLISIPCLAIIPTTLVIGRVMTKVSHKTLALSGAICFLVGGAAPAFIPLSFYGILVCRALMGIGVGISQVISTALNAYYFSGEEQKKVQGNIQAYQMVGVAVMVFAGGWLAELKWNYVFYIHLAGLLTLFAVIFYLPGDKADSAEKISSSDNKEKNRFNALYKWIILIFFSFISIQIYSIYFAFLVSEKNIGTASDSGLGIAFFALGGIITGVCYNWYVQLTKHFDISIGFLVLAAGYYLIAFSVNMALCYIGSILIGIATSIILPGILIRAGKSVAPYYTGIAISVVTCGQNLGQCLCSYLISPLVTFFSLDGNSNFTAFMIGGAMSTALFIIMLIYGIRTTPLKDIKINNHKEYCPGNSPGQYSCKLL